MTARPRRFPKWEKDGVVGGREIEVGGAHPSKIANGAAASALKSSRKGGPAPNLTP